MTDVIVLPDGSVCDPWIEDCPVGTDEDQYSTSLMLVGKNAAVVYGAIATMSALIPPVIWFADR